MARSTEKAGANGWSYEAIQLLLKDRPVAYHPIIARTLGSVTGALFLSQVLYWQDKGDEGNGWFYKTQIEIEHETGLSRREQETARKVCRSAGVLEEKRMGVPSKLYYRPNVDKLIDLLAGGPEEGSEGPEDEKPDPDKDGSSNDADAMKDSTSHHIPETIDEDGAGENSWKSQNVGKRHPSMSESDNLEWRDRADKNGDKRQTSYSTENTPESTDLPSVGPSDALAREDSPSDSGARTKDQLTDGLSEENSYFSNTDASTTAIFPKLQEPQHEQSNAPDLLPREDEDNAAPNALEALRQQVETIPTSEVSEGAQSLARKVIANLPDLSDRDRCRVAKLAEHYHRQGREAVLSGAAAGMGLYAAHQRIDHPFPYLLACCVDLENESSSADEDLLRSLSGEDDSNTSEESDSSSYEWFFNSEEQESDAGEGQQRQHTPESDPEALALWEKVLEDVSDEINAPSLRVWFEGTIPVSLSANTLTVSVPNSFARDYIESRFKELLEGALSKHLSLTSGSSPRLEIVVGIEGSTDNTGMRESP